MKKTVLFLTLLCALNVGAQVVITEPGISPATIDTDTLAIVDGKLTVLGGGEGGGVWGGIAGTLSAQTDLWSQLTNRYTIAEILALPIGSFTNTAGYITTYVVTAADVTNHQASITISTNQISDLTLPDLSPYAQISDGSRFHSVWTGPTNRLYIVSPDGAYTNLLMTTVGE